MASDSMVAAAAKAAGRKPICRRMILNAILYVLRTGCQWWQLPHDFPNWKSVYTVFWRWRQTAVWKRVHDALRQRVRRAAGKKRTPTAAIMDSQSVRAEEGDERGYDAGKKVTDRKRHLAADTLGLIVAVVVHGTDWQDHHGGALVLARLRMAFGRLKVVFSDSAYARNGLPDWVQTTFGWVLQTVPRPVGLQALWFFRSAGPSNGHLPSSPLSPTQQRL